MTACPRCRDATDPDTGRHIDEDGQVMSYREDLIHCRPDSDPRQAAYIASKLAERGISLPIAKPLRYSGYDII